MTHCKTGGGEGVLILKVFLFVLLTLNVNFFEMCVGVSDTETNLWNKTNLKKKPKQLFPFTCLKSLILVKLCFKLKRSLLVICIYLLKHYIINQNHVSKCNSHKISALR